ncbi:hypothetical protein B0T26DRAFT_804729 [Lasiosphaeria miniovina]|uniref:Uncharacterized protein n=1 Tax=Lasiosphaeria miniovina TaxID=1954250 RepID=A0AA40ADY2_9PEZI|nr:uncharacterized protein B0T26DRAFT_804729 [Lasiosphaeria miniovina]KAK0714147.1 hypothetical protein B0T26DRAFT_804729 [Lasiosphaeria miniovina]
MSGSARPTLGMVSKLLSSPQFLQHFNESRPVQWTQTRPFSVFEYYTKGGPKFDIQKPPNPQTGEGGSYTQRAIPPKAWVPLHTGYLIDMAKKFVAAHEKQLDKIDVIERLPKLARSLEPSNEGYASKVFYIIMAPPLEFALEHVEMPGKPGAWTMTLSPQDTHGKRTTNDFVKIDLVLKLYHEGNFVQDLAVLDLKASEGLGLAERSFNNAKSEYSTYKEAMGKYTPADESKFQGPAEKLVKQGVAYAEHTRSFDVSFYDMKQLLIFGMNDMKHNPAGARPTADGGLVCEAAVISSNIEYATLGFFLNAINKWKQSNPNGSPPGSRPRTPAPR